MPYNSRRQQPKHGYDNQSRDYRHDNDRNRDRSSRGRPSSPPPRREYRDSGDSYRPPSPSSHGYGRSKQNGYGSRPSYGAPMPPPPSYNPPPPPSYPPPPGVDSYRMPQSDFTFRVEKPAGLQQEPDSYRPENNRRARHDRGANGGRGGRDARHGNGARGRPGRGGKFRQPWRPFVAAERDLLHTDHNVGDEQAYFDEQGGVTYRNIDELSDSEEAEMEISGDEGNSDTEPSSKRARVSVDQSAADDVPKWSNPDPYTALPPETAGQKKKDVVQLIRKARVQTKETRTSLPSEAADFISLDFDDSDDGGDSDHTKASDLVFMGESKVDAAPVATDGSTLSHDGTGFGKPSRVPRLLPDPTPAALGSRKRTHDDQIKMPHTRMKRPAKAPSGGSIIPEWRPLSHMSPTPWLRMDNSDSKDPIVWLHKEIVDFYDYIKPREFEHHLRHDLVQRMRSFCRRYWRDSDMQPFGSFPSGLYLPTGDMDMVMVSNSYLQGGAAKYHMKKHLWQFKSFLLKEGVAWEDDVEVITKAKVPLAKFVDQKTGLKVDISFENSTGITAIETFLAWKDIYPGMPALVTLIKHFLLMRGLNEPVNGGIGGFSVICLVVSMLQMMPEVQCGAMDTRHHLGDLLMHFFDLYGNKFDYQNIAIRLDPPGYVKKTQVGSFAYKNYDRLSIIDPNNEENDISGGSSNTGHIFSIFSRAHDDLRQRMRSMAEDPRRGTGSILGVIMGGNYSSFEEQRSYLEKLANREPGSPLPARPRQPHPQGQHQSHQSHQPSHSNHHSDRRRNARGNRRRP
ncbi:putative Poly(A) RNA polymerase protein [Triangularia verruculosa]|uniref:polynucleotide adenylyltransferase n=1 Tax=Triangularia verruculosa TaxID=2587418 RepID=A0AAN6XPI1_9PEZI|nr:putative Poly(A) RNA polymerase protein [Triangularia verruculosa]